MRIQFLCLTLLTMLNLYCSDSQGGVLLFDQDINSKLNQYKYKNFEMSGPDFANLKAGLLKNNKKIEFDFSDIDAYSLNSYIGNHHPPIDTVSKLSEKIHPSSIPTFVKLVLQHNLNYFGRHREFFINLIDSNTNGHNTKESELLSAYIASDRDFTKFKNYLDEIVIDQHIGSLCADLILVDMPVEYNLQLLNYFAEREEWEKCISNYMDYLKLADTSDSHNSLKYKNFIKSQLLKSGFNTVWKAYNIYLFRWFAADEVMEITMHKRKEQLNANSADWYPYVRYAGFCQIMYLDSDDTIDIIDRLSYYFEKINFITDIANLRPDLTDEQKSKLLDMALNAADNLDERSKGMPDSVIRALIKAVKSLDRDFSYEKLTERYKDVFSRAGNTEYLRHLFTGEHYNWRDYLKEANRLNTFNIRLNDIDTIGLCEHLWHFSAYRNHDAIFELLKSNHLNAVLTNSTSEFIVDYPQHIGSAIKGVFNHHLKAPYDCTFEYIEKGRYRYEYTIYFRLGTKVHKITIPAPEEDTSDFSILDNDAVYLLLNKALMEAGSEYRLYRNPDIESIDYNMLLVNPDKYKELSASLNPAY